MTRSERKEGCEGATVAKGDTEFSNDKEFSNEETNDQPVTAVVSVRNDGWVF